MLDRLHEDTGTVLMVEVVLLKGHHLVPKLTIRVKSLQILLIVTHILHIFVTDVCTTTTLYHYLLYQIRVEEILRRRIFVHQMPLNPCPIVTICHYSLFILQYKPLTQQQQQMQDINQKIEFNIFQGRYKEALALVDNIIQEKSTDANVYLKKAFLLSKLKRYEQAIIACQTAKQFNADLLVTTQQIMQFQMQLYHIQDAQRTFKQFLIERKDIANLFQIKDQLKNLNLNISNKEKILLQQLKKWQYQSGAIYDKLKVVEFTSSYRGVISVNSILPKQRIVFIPNNNFISLQIAKQHPICQTLINNKVKILSPKHNFLSIFLLSERQKKDSKWRYYIDLLPQDHSNFPINFTTIQLSYLIGSPFLFQIKEKVYDLRLDYDQIIKACPQMSQYNFKEYCWARMTVGSRIFGIKINGIKTQILVPFADMLNHKLPKQTVWNYSSQMNGFYIQSLFHINPGEEVFDSYGRKCNSRFLLNYGFVVDDNSDNEICLKLTINEECVLAKEKLAMLKQTKTYVKILKTSINLNSIKFYELMAYLRFYEIKNLQLLQVLKKISRIQVTKDPYCPEKTPPLNFQLQLNVWKKLQSLLKLSLKEYPSIIEEDVLLLKEMGLSQNIKNIIKIRMGEKKVIKNLIQVSEHVIQTLQLEQKMTIQKISANRDRQWAIYLAKMLQILPPHQRHPAVQSIQLKEQEQIIEAEEQLDEQN